VYAGGRRCAYEGTGIWGSVHKNAELNVEIFVYLSALTVTQGAELVFLDTRLY